MIGCLILGVPIGMIVAAVLISAGLTRYTVKPGMEFWKGEGEWKR